MTITLSPLIILFGAELLLLLIAFAIFMAISRHRYKKLYKKLLSDQMRLSTVERIDRPEAEAVKKEGEPIMEAAQEVVKEQDTTDIQKDATTSVDAQIPPMEQDASEITASDKPNEEADIMPEEQGSRVGVQKLKKIVDFQKEKIVNLMCYKDILESAQKKLTNIHTDYEDLAQRFASLSEAMGSNKEFELALEMFGENTTELKDFIDALQNENETLLEKFNTWEGQLQGLWQESEEIVEGATSEDLEAIAAEKNELLEKIREFEEKLKEKSKQLEEAQAQYEDLEKEYLVLYKQQQGTTKA